MTNSILKENLDEIVTKEIEKAFPVKCSNDGTYGFFTFDERFLPFEGVKIKLQSAHYDDISNHMTFGYNIVENPKNIPRSADLEQILFRIVLFIYEIESQIILKRG